jgi:hypothetical protein
MVRCGRREQRSDACNRDEEVISTRKYMTGVFVGDYRRGEGEWREGRGSRIGIVSSKIDI